MWRLANPWYLLLLLIPAGLLAWHLWSRKRGRSSLLFSGGHYLNDLPVSWRAVVSPRLHWLRYPGLILLTIAMTRPQTGNAIREIETFGVDIMLVLDVSGTMALRDMISEEGRRITRLAAAREVMSDFVGGRDSDRIGVIAFGSQSLTRCPLTNDYDLVSQALESIELDLFPEDMRDTAIGNALATGVSRLWKSDARSKVIVLLTDGENTAGNIAPLDAAKIAKSEGVKVYTIGFGRSGQSVDEQNLREVAEATDGQFFRSYSMEDLKEVYELIDQLEKSQVVIKNFELWEEWFHWFLWTGCGLLLIEVLFHQIFCRRVP